MSRIEVQGYIYIYPEKKSIRVVSKDFEPDVVIKS
jgi:hypothetical protein